ncbi:MAG: DUF4124 domain-containing protein [Gammaproteobacteria bacterium]
MMRFKLLVLAIFLSNSASADVYKCIDANGKTAYQAKPCAVDESAVEINFKTGAAIDTQTDKARKASELEKQILQEKAKLEAERKKQQLLIDAKAEAEKNQTLVKKNTDQFSAYAIPPYDPANLTDLVKNFEDRLADIERMRRLAALKVLSSGGCQRVEASELNIKSTREKLIFLVNCSTGQGTYVGENELK